MSRTEKVKASEAPARASNPPATAETPPPLASLSAGDLDALLRRIAAEHEARVRPVLDEVERREAEKDRRALALRRGRNEFVAQNGTWFIERLGVEHLTSHCADHEFRDDCPRCVLEQAREYNRLDDEYCFSLVVEKRPLRDPDGEAKR